MARTHASVLALMAIAIAGLQDRAMLVRFNGASPW